MKPVEYYKGREQTYLKHFFLEHYLERVVHKVGFKNPNFTYVDGFSGPWKSKDEDYQDTSFGIALSQLRIARKNLEAHKKYLNLKCLFIEKEREAYQELEKRVKSVDDLEAKSIHGRFEDLIPEIKNFIGSSFSFIFIDPTGWTGFALNKIQPILLNRGEVLINFMFGFINRFINFQDQKNIETFNNLFGSSDWRNELEIEKAGGKSDEEAILTIYLNRLKKIGNYPFVTYTKILKPITEKSFFHLIYGTRNLEGLRVFSKIAEKLFKEQTVVRGEAKQRKRIERTGQGELFGSDFLSENSRLLINDRNNNLQNAEIDLRKFISEKKSIMGHEVLGRFLEYPFVWENDINDWVIKKLKKSGSIEIPNMGPRERTLKPHHQILKK